MAKVTWLGDEDPSAQVVTHGGHTFVKGEAVDVPNEDLAKFENHPMFSTSGKAKATEAQEPPAPDAEAGTTKGALRDELRAMGVTVQGNPSEETLRNRLAAEVAKRKED